MKLNSKFQLRTNVPQKGAYGSIWLNCKPQEVLDAEATGVGPGAIESSGTPTQGTFEPGVVIQLNAAGAFELATPAVLGTDMPKMYFVVFAGNNDFSLDGSIFVFHGGARFETIMFDAGSGYDPGLPLVVSGATDGNLALKAAAGDNVQVVGYVGPKGLRPNGALEVLFPQNA